MQQYVEKIRATIESLLFITNEPLTPAQLAELAEMEEVILLSEFHVKKPESKQMVRLDGRFHEIMYRASGSRMLEHVLTDFLHYVKMARSHSVKTEHRAQESVKEHKRILEAIRQRDGDLAEQLANEHIQHVIENLDLH